MHRTLLLFGATGDLAQRYLFPSLANLIRDRLLPDDSRIIAVARRGFRDTRFRDSLADVIAIGIGPDAATPFLLAHVPQPRNTAR
jgi:glucose-6-phosphate 1-dehydrogenase